MEAGKDLRTPALARLAQHAVIGNLIIEPIAQKPHIIQALGDDFHQLPLTADVVVEQQEHHFENDHWVHRFIAVLTVEHGHLLPHKSEIDLLGNPAQGMIAANPPIQIDVVAEQILLRLLMSHHVPR